MNYSKEQIENFLYSTPEITNNFTGKIKDIEVMAVYDYTNNAGEDAKGIKFKLTNKFRFDRALDFLEAGDLDNAKNFNLSTDYLHKYIDNKFVPSKGDIVTLVIKQLPVKDSDSGETFPIIDKIIEQKAEVIGVRARPSTKATSEVEDVTLEEALASKKK